MMKFYHSTGTCSMAAHIVIEELGIPHSPVEVSFRKDINVTELNRVNPLGAVPVLVTDDAKALTQNVAILEYLAELKPSGGLLAPAGSWERHETVSWLAFIASDLQKAFSPLFRLEQLTSSEAAQKEIETHTKANIRDVLEVIEQKLSGRDYAVGSNFTIADAYLFTIVGWTKWVEIDTHGFKNITRYMKRVYDRPAVRRVLEKEEALDYIQ
jgi:glutathione S-transferase